MNESYNLNTIGFDNPELYEKALVIANQFNFNIDNQVLPRLSLTQDKLVLLTNDFLPLFVDFNNQSLQKRLQAGKKQGLIRACKPAKGIKILDVTAGWGRDAALLASYGADVLMLERQPMMVALLADALGRIHSNVGSNLSLLHIDAKHYLQSLSEENYPDVIYIDPMHPVRLKSALVKKDMQVLQQLIGADDDVFALTELALLRVRDRVVVKWPQRLTALKEPHSSIPGTTVRFDIYL